MKRIILALAFLLAGAVNAFAQSTTVSGQVTDAGAQSWNGGSFTFTFVPNPSFPVGPYTWTGGTLNSTVTGFMNSSGAYSVSVPSNSAISPIGSTWILTACPNATSPCFSAATTVITGATQTLNATPPAIAINITNPPGSSTSAYTDAEIVGAIIGSQYYNVTSALVRVCQAVTGQACTAWANVGFGAGGSVAFGSITSGTNTTAAMVVGSGASLSATGGGTIIATNGISGQVTGFLPKAASSTSLTPSLCDEAITTLNTLTCTDTGGLAIPSVATGSSPPVATSLGTSGTTAYAEGTAPVWPAGADALWGDSTLHCLHIINNGIDNGCPQTRPDRVPTGSTDTILSTDRVGRVAYNASGAVAVTLPQAGSAGFGSAFYFYAANANTAPSAVTITPTTSTINGQATLVLNLGDWCIIGENTGGTNYNANCTSSQIVAGANIALTTASHALTVAVTVPASANLLSSTAGSIFAAATAHNESVPPACAAASGSGSAYTCSTTPTFAPAAGDEILFKADLANTGAATLKVNAQAGTPGINKIGGSAVLAANDLLAGQYTILIYDGTNWDMQGQIGNAPATGTVTSIATTSPITGGTITTTGTIACATCVTSAASLANGGIVLGTAGTQASATNTQLTFVAPTLTVGLAGTSSGILNLAGSTSGGATITAPAVAGTISNPVTFSNAIQLPTGDNLPTTPELSFANAGLYTSGSALISWEVGALGAGVDGGVLYGSGIRVINTAGYEWSSTVSSIGSPDTGIGRSSAGVLSVDTGTIGNTAGRLNATTVGLGVSGTSAGTLIVNNATSGAITVSPPTGALGSVAITWPSATGTLATTTQAFPVTVTGGVSGAIPCFTSTTTEAAGTLLTANVLPKGGGAGVCPSNSLITDNGTTATYTGTGGYSAPVLTSTVATGTAPLVVTSTTTVPNLTLSNHPKEQFCGTTSACSATAETSPKIVFGSAPLVTGTPSTVTISGISPAFTATADYVCTVSAPGASAATALLGVTNVSASSFTITGPTSVTTVISYICVGF